MPGNENFDREEILMTHREATIWLGLMKLYIPLAYREYPA
jgi:hypothetical protein